MKNKVQLITYPDSIGGDLLSLNNLLNGALSGLFPGGVHILPPFPSSGDRGFAPTTYRKIDPSFGTWDDIQKISEKTEIMLDMMVNHISRFSVYFQDFLQHGRASQYADMFITLDKVWAEGNPPPEDVQKIFLRKPQHPFLNVKIEETGKIDRVWASFGPRVDYSEQIDIDVHSPLTQKFFVDLFAFFSRQNVKMIRLDAIGYVIKKAGTSCFMVEPDIYNFIDWLTEKASDYGLILLPEVHAHYTKQFRLAAHGFYVYDFVLPMLVLYSLRTGRSKKLLKHLEDCPPNQITMLDCHDGIPVQPDMDDVLSVEESSEIVQLCLERGANLNRILSKTGQLSNFDVHQINITYFEALGKDDNAYLIARAIQFFAPGIPQVYYVGLLAGENDVLSVAKTGEGRAINRHNFSNAEVEIALKKEVVQRLVNLIVFRNEHPAFNGKFSIVAEEEGKFLLRWKLDNHFCELAVFLEDCWAEIRYTGADELEKRYVI